MTPERLKEIIHLTSPYSSVNHQKTRQALLDCIGEIERLQRIEPLYDSSLLEIERLQADTDSNDCWMREVLTDFNIPYDDHKVGRRLAITQWMRDRNAQIARLRAIVEKGTE